MEAPNLRVFSFHELERATRKFKNTSLSGKSVYKGIISAKETSPSTNKSKFIGYLKRLRAILLSQDDRWPRIQVVVKSYEEWQGYEEWQNKVARLGSLSHPNLVKLLGGCCEDKERLLVYEYMPKGSLDDYLYKRKWPRLGWETRISIALGAAHGLAYLHALETPILQTDFNASDVLLDESFNAKIITKLGSPVQNEGHRVFISELSCLSTPEYVGTGHSSRKSDVYKFGLVLLEMLTGMPAQHHFIKKWEEAGAHGLWWVKPCLYDRKRLKNIMDESILVEEDVYPLINEAFEIAKLVLRCIEEKPKARPSMAQVVQMLESHISRRASNRS